MMARYPMEGLFGGGSQLLFFLVVLLLICGCDRGVCDGDGFLGNLFGNNGLLLILVFLFFFGCGGCGFGY